MKRIFIIIVLLASFGQAFSQVPEHIKRHYTNSIDVYHIFPINKPADFLHKAINPGVNINASYVIPFGKSNFGFSIGAGFAFQNYYLKSLPKDMIPKNLRQEAWGDDYYFKPLDSIISNPLGVAKNKMVLSYFDVPLELRYCADNGIKFSAGVKISFLISSKHKYKGSDYVFDTDETIKIKKYNLNGLSNFTIGPVARFGWKWFNVFASYSFVNIFDETAGNKLNPLSVGISFTPDHW